MLDMTTPFKLTPLQYYGTWTLIFVMVVCFIIEIKLHANERRRSNHFEDECGKYERSLMQIQVDCDGWKHHYESAQASLDRELENGNQQAQSIQCLKIKEKTLLDQIAALSDELEDKNKKLEATGSYDVKVTVKKKAEKRGKTK